MTPISSLLLASSLNFSQCNHLHTTARILFWKINFILPLPSTNTSNTSHKVHSIKPIFRVKAGQQLTSNYPCTRISENSPRRRPCASPSRRLAHSSAAPPPPGPCSLIPCPLVISPCLQWCPRQPGVAFSVLPSLWKMDIITYPAHHILYRPLHPRSVWEGVEWR